MYRGLLVHFAYIIELIDVRSFVIHESMNQLELLSELLLSHLHKHIHRRLVLLPYGVSTVSHSRVSVVPWPKLLLIHSLSRSISACDAVRAQTF